MGRVWLVVLGCFVLGQLATSGAQSSQSASAWSASERAKEHEDREAARPLVLWVAKTAARLEDTSGYKSRKTQHGSGAALWADTARVHVREEDDVASALKSPGFETVPPALQPVAHELSVAKSALAITDPAFDVSRNTMMVLGRPVQAGLQSIFISSVVNPMFMYMSDPCVAEASATTCFWMGIHIAEPSTSILAKIC